MQKNKITSTTPWTVILFFCIMYPTIMHLDAAKFKRIQRKLKLEQIKKNQNL